jgi:GGDEF domain-containing protein
MAYLAQHDALTQLPNRLMLNDRLNQAMILARRHQQKLAILFVDIDRFKQVNDSLGHAIGDRLLQSVAERLLACVRCRYRCGKNLKLVKRIALHRGARRAHYCQHRHRHVSRWWRRRRNVTQKRGFGNVSGKVASR